MNASRQEPDRVREKLIKAAGDVFAEVGFEAATIRDICARAGANVAAVNYYFGDKLELYTEVLRSAAPGHASVLAAFESSAPKEEILRHAIRAMLQKMCGEEQLDIQFRLMAHEMVRPTPAVERVVDEVVRPVYDRLRKLIGGILRLPADHEQTRLCTHSVIGQCSHYSHSRLVMRHLWPEMKMNPEQLDRIADHVLDFSLAYLRSVSRSGAASRPARLKVIKIRKKNDTASH